MLQTSKFALMNRKLRITLLAMLGLSTAACCNTKKTTSGTEGDAQPVGVDGEAPRPIAMYAAPMPYPMPAEIEEPQANRPTGLVTPEGSEVIVLSAEDSQRIIELFSTEFAGLNSSLIYELEDGRIAMALPAELAARVTEVMQQLNIAVERVADAE